MQMPSYRRTTRPRPDVRAGAIEADVVKRFAESVPMAGVDAQAFVEYWQSVGGVCPRDSYFVMLVRVSSR